MYKIDNAPNILCPRCKELFNFTCKLVSCLNKSTDAATELVSKKSFFEDQETLAYNLTRFLKVISSQHANLFGLPTKPVALLVSGVNTSSYSYKFNSLIYPKTLVKWISR